MNRPALGRITWTIDQKYVLECFLLTVSKCLLQCFCMLMALFTSCHMTFLQTQRRVKRKTSNMRHKPGNIFILLFWRSFVIWVDVLSSKGLQLRYRASDVWLFSTARFQMYKSFCLANCSWEAFCAETHHPSAITPEASIIKSPPLLTLLLSSGAG